MKAYPLRRMVSEPAVRLQCCLLGRSRPYATLCALTMAELICVSDAGGTTLTSCSGAMASHGHTGESKGNCILQSESMQCLPLPRSCDVWGCSPLNAVT